ncbi:hypothetical protein DFQ26_008720 [Actinomortierella ambigua]|nr:hypothetical protein DFQ26_008720 [Actinomortierella ambigua]
MAQTLTAGDNEIDELYQADTLRQLEADWLKQRAYASLRLRILGDDEDDDDEDEEDEGENPDDSHRPYYLMDQFLIAESYVFRDFFKALRRGDDLSTIEDDDRLACLRIDHFPDASSAAPSPQSLLQYSPHPSPAPTSGVAAAPSPLPGILPPPLPVDDDQLLLVTLFLPYPDLFKDHLLPLFYELYHDTSSWVREKLQPSTLGKTFLNLSRLECRSDWLLGCLRYFGEIKASRDRDPDSWNILQEDQDAFQVLTAAYENAQQHNLL